MEFNSVIIVGSVRSGTNMLRDILSSIPNYGTWDCDEINPIWRHGNINYPNDELKPEMLNPKIIRLIRNEFKKLSKSLKVDNVVEKTTATSLRVAYTYEVVPEAKYIFIYRDGRDVAASAQKRWNASFDFMYSWKKFRYVPKVDMPAIAYYYIANRIKKLISGKESLSTWGPRYEGMDEDVRNHSLIEVCALQWQNYVERSLDQLHVIPEDQLLKVQYEIFVNNPQEELKRICSFLGVENTSEEIQALTAKVSNRSVGNWKKLPKEEQETLNKHLSSTLSRLGYETS